MVKRKSSGGQSPATKNAKSSPASDMPHVNKILQWWRTELIAATSVKFHPLPVFHIARLRFQEVVVPAGGADKHLAKKYPTQVGSLEILQQQTNHPSRKRSLALRNGSKTTSQETTQGAVLQFIVYWLFNSHLLALGRSLTHPVAKL